MNEQEMDIFKIISSAGDARGSAFEGLRLARKGKFEQADNKMKEAKEKSMIAHEVQTRLITDEINGTPHESNLLMIHAQDHLMTSILARDLIEEMIEMLKEKNMNKSEEEK